MESQQSPYASPGATDDTVEQLVGNQAYQALRYLQWVYIAMGLQLGSAIAIPLVAALVKDFAGDSMPPGWFGYLFYGWLAVLYVLSAYCLLRLMIATKSNVFTLIIYVLFALCPCIGLFALLTVAETMRDSMEKQGVPFRRSGPDWKTMRAMAASQALENESPSNETTS